MASIAATPSVSASVLHTRVPMDPAAPVTISVHSLPQLLAVVFSLCS